MNESKSSFKYEVVGCLTALSLFICLPAAVLADQPGQFQSGKAGMDDPMTMPGKPAGTTSEPALRGSTALNESQKFELSATKLTSGAEMTRDDFRDLGIGTLGFSANQSSNDRYAKVNNVFAGSPAEAAGIQVGDIVLNNDGLPNAAPGSWDQERWRFHFDHVGTQSVVTIKRGRDKLSFTLTRMNIEDLPDAKVRRVYEEQAVKLGSSGQGTIDTTRRPR